MKRLSPLAYNIYRLTPDTKLREQRRFFKLYLTALIVLAFGALVIWKAESNYREGLKKPVQVDSVESKAIPVRPAVAWEGSTTVSDAGIEITETPRGISFTF